MPSQTTGQTTFDWGWRGDAGTWRQLHHKYVCQESPDFKTNTGVLGHTGFDPDFGPSL